MKVRVIWKPGGIRNRSGGAELEAPPQALVDTCAHILWGVDDGACWTRSKHRHAQSGRRTWDHGYRCRLTRKF